MKILSAGLLGLRAEVIEVESCLGGGEMGLFTIVGLPDKAVSEARERVRGAIAGIGLKFPKRKVIVNLAPADFKKYGPSYDLPIAISVLSNVYDFKKDLSNDLFIGELALNGDVRPVGGILSIVSFAKKIGIKNVFLPVANLLEASLVKNIKLSPLENLKEISNYLINNVKIEEKKINFSQPKKSLSFFDFANIKGHHQSKRALEIAVAGGHNLLMAGPPGSGKTILAKSATSIMPRLSDEELIEVTEVYSIAGKLSKNGVVSQRPFRSPHHTASASSIVGGGSWPRPGEISLAHRGILFLDEFPEFPRFVLENLRQPLEDGFINICRAAGAVSFPARFMLLGAMNPCPCGYFGDKKRECICSSSQLENYQKKISGPIKDRIDININVPRLEFEEISSFKKDEECSSKIAQRIYLAKEIQRKRFNKEKIFANAEMNHENINSFCRLSENQRLFLKRAVDRLSLSARAYFKIIKLARTIADLRGDEALGQSDLSEAIFYHSNL